MRRIFLFMNVSLDGYVEAPGDDLSWAHNDFEAFSLGESSAVDTILLGRRTFEMMRNFWPTPQAHDMIPDVAAFMNSTQKVVATHNAAFEPGWQSTAVFSGDVVAEVRQLKQQAGKDIIILGSNNLCVSLMQAGLIDEFQIQVNPVVLGEGTSLFAGLPEKTPLTLADSRTFKSGVTMLTYKPSAT